MPATQTFKNHGRFDPVFHFFLMPILLANVIFVVSRTIHEWPHRHRTHIIWIVLSVVAFLAVSLMRRYALKNQDRIIRLEERLRLAALAPMLDPEAFSTRQLIALRFASDAELPALAARAVAENLDAKQIKQSIATWRPDNERI